MKHLPIGIQTFSDLIEGNYLYIDKTQDIYPMLTKGGKYYFLSRPRRIGKSLLVSTLKEIFSGNRDLFKGLWIYDKIQWETFPVIHIDFSTLSYKTPEILEKSLEKSIRKIGKNYGVAVDADSDFKSGFRELIEGLAVKNKVVILIDEYDKPIIDKIEDKETAKSNRDVLREFFAVLKASDEYNRFAFITGVSKFIKVSVFSDLNNLIDLTIDERFSTLVGYTHGELLEYFGDRIGQLPDGNNENQWVEDIKTWYNGYSWDGKRFVYNPFSILCFFREKEFRNFWFESGSPSFLVKLIRQYQTAIPELENYKTGESAFSTFDIDRMHVVSLLFQTGYLTIKEIETSSDKKRFYILSYPNKEVKESFMEHLLADYSPKNADRISVIVEILKENIEKDNLEKFFEVMRSLFAAIPYDIFVMDREGYYQTVVYLVLSLLGIRIKCEPETNQGRIDAVIETGTAIYILEFKLGTAQNAMNQIKEKKYYEPYQVSSKEIKLIGIGLDKETRNIGDYIVEELPGD